MDENKKLEEKKINILEECTEDVCISSNCWSPNEERKTEEEAKIIVQAIKELVDGKLIVATKERYDKDRTYKEVPLDIDRLTYEVMRSMNPDEIVPADEAYWFYATKEGEKAYQAWAKEYWTEERVAKEKEKWKKKSNGEW